MLFPALQFHSPFKFLVWCYYPWIWNHVFCHCNHYAYCLYCRCFCELSRQIGFNDQASDGFKTEITLGMYRHIVGFSLAELPECLLSYRDIVFLTLVLSLHKTPRTDSSGAALLSSSTRCQCPTCFLLLLPIQLLVLKNLFQHLMDAIVLELNTCLLFQAWTNFSLKGQLTFCWTPAQTSGMAMIWCLWLKLTGEWPVLHYLPIHVQVYSLEGPLLHLLTVRGYLTSTTVPACPPIAQHLPTDLWPRPWVLSLAAFIWRWGLTHKPWPPSALALPLLDPGTLILWTPEWRSLLRCPLMSVQIHSSIMPAWNLCMTLLDASQLSVIRFSSAWSPCSTKPSRWVLDLLLSLLLVTWPL